MDGDEAVTNKPMATLVLHTGICVEQAQSTACLMFDSAQNAGRFASRLEQFDPGFSKGSSIHQLPIGVSK
jgi:hypothetical protein